MWTGLADKEKAEMIVERKADRLECSECIIRRVNKNRASGEGREG
jgi:hypothetical protein